MKLIARIQTKLKAALYGTDPLTFFKRFDLDGGGTLDYEEFRKLVRGTLKITPRELPDKDVRKVLLALDDDSSGELDIVELADFVRRGVSTDPGSGEPAAVALLFDSYGEEQVRTFEHMCRSMDSHTTMPVSQTVLSKSPSWSVPVAGVGVRRRPAGSGTVNTFMFDQTIHVVIQARNKYVNHEEGTRAQARYDVRPTRGQDLTFKQEHKIKSLKEVHSILDVDNGSYRWRMWCSPSDRHELQTLQTMRQHHPQDQPSPLFVNWPTSASSGVEGSCGSALRRSSASQRSTPVLDTALGEDRLEGAGRVSRRIWRGQFSTSSRRKPTAEFETPIMLAKSCRRRRRWTARPGEPRQEDLQHLQVHRQVQPAANQPGPVERVVQDHGRAPHGHPDAQKGQADGQAVPRPAPRHRRVAGPEAVVRCPRRSEVRRLRHLQPPHLRPSWWRRFAKWPSTRTAWT